MTTRPTLALLGNHLVECQHCSVDNNTYCVQYLKLVADLFRNTPQGTATVDNDHS